MIEGHGDDSYKYSRPITANFSSNVYSRVDLSALKAHLCARIDGIGNYPELLAQGENRKVRGYPRQV